MVLVSHDRHLLRTATDELMLVADGRVHSSDGDLDEYRSWLAGKRAPSAEVVKKAAPAPAPEVNRRDERRVAAESRQIAARRKPLTERAARLEKQLARLSGEKAQLDTLLASEALYASEKRDELKAATFAAARVAADLETLEEEWLNLQSELDALNPDHA